MDIELVKATLISGELILINEFKIESIWLDKKDVCHIVLESGSTLKVKESFFKNIINTKEKDNKR